MGDWAIVVEGTGAHHNKEFPNDADRLAQRFVDDLIKAGHEVRLATFTAGGRTVLDTSDNLRAVRSKSSYFDDPINLEQLDVSIQQRRDSLSYIGLAQAPRKDPVVADGTVGMRRGT